jgi:hypothetical protein
MGSMSYVLAAEDETAEDEAAETALVRANQAEVQV